jgi:lipoprotein Spr
MKSKYLILPLILIIFAGCGPKPPSTNDSSNRYGLGQRERERLIEAAREYLGVNYKYNGQDLNGIDCSGFVHKVYIDALDMGIPRTTKGLYKCSRPINLSSAKPGDLVFFSTARNGRGDHVGLLLDKTSFIHASKSQGVVVSSFEEEYYWKRFLCARRLRFEMAPNDWQQADRDIR